MLLNDILKLKFPNVSFIKDIILQDDGEGIYIKEWNLTDPCPIQEDLDQWGDELDLQYRQEQAVAQRTYPPISDQLDMLYHDYKDKTTIWADTIEAIKLAHPKPTE